MCYELIGYSRTQAFSPQHLLLAVLMVGEGLVKLSYVQMTYLDVWRSGTFLEKPQVS